MRISVRVTPKSSKNEIVKEGDLYKVKVTVPPEGGKANEIVIELLAKEFHVPKSFINVISGSTSRNKIIEIQEKI